MQRNVKFDPLDHSSDERFSTYYADKSVEPRFVEHWTRLQTKLLAMRARRGLRVEGLKVLDVGCNAGTQARLWSQAGHQVTGLDVNEPLLQLARRRAQEDGLDIRFDLGTATQLPYASGSFDVCLMLELLEHVQDWESCVNEAVRVLAPGGVLYLSTTNALCPKQQEFNLPLYSWYPAALKRRYEKLAVTSRPELANFARYPAVHWFTYAQLRSYLAARSMTCFDRFDLLDADRMGWGAKWAVRSLRALAPLRWLAHVATPGTSVMAFAPEPKLQRVH